MDKHTWSASQPIDIVYQLWSRNTSPGDSQDHASENL